jgi:hypothetical protein
LIKLKLFDPTHLARVYQLQAELQHNLDDIDLSDHKFMIKYIKSEKIDDFPKEGLIKYHQDCIKYNDLASFFRSRSRDFVTDYKQLDHRSIRKLASILSPFVTIEQIYP